MTQMLISLRKTVESDLVVFYQNQTDEEANLMTAFTLEVPESKSVYIKKWSRIIQNDSVNMQTILLDNQVIGNVLIFIVGEDTDMMYAIDKKFWGKGITSTAVKRFLEIEETRPIFGRTAIDNYGSQKILEKNGFKKIGSKMEFANARGIEIEEYIYRLDGFSKANNS